MTPPIFIACSDGDILAFASVAEAESALESPDVESGEFTGAFDADGTRLGIEVLEPTKTRRILGFTILTLSPVKIRPISAPKADANSLRRLLAARLGEESATSDLNDLVERAYRELSSR
jgi:hypothetical protein